MTTITDRIYGAQTAGVGRTVQDIGLCDLTGEYVYTAKTRMKGLMVVVFFSPDSAPSVRALQAVQGWIADLPTQKWTALAVSEGDADAARRVRAGARPGRRLRPGGPRAVPDAHLGRLAPAEPVSDFPQGPCADEGDRRPRRGLERRQAAPVGRRWRTLVAAEAAAKKAEEEKKAAEAAAKK